MQVASMYKYVFSFLFIIVTNLNYAKIVLLTTFWLNSFLFLNKVNVKLLKLLKLLKHVSSCDDNFDYGSLMQKSKQT